MKTLAFIAAKCDSMRFPRKNLTEFRGLPLVAHAIRVANEAKAVGLVDQVVLSYDWWAVVQAARRGGPSLELEQPEAIARTHPPVINVLRSVLQDWKAGLLVEAHDGTELGELPDVVCVLWATSPLRTVRHLVESFRLLDADATGVLSLVNVTREVRGACIVAGGMVALDRLAVLTADTEFLRHDGTVAWLRTQHVLAGGGFYDGVARLYEIPPEESADIDTALDLEWAEFLAARTGRKESSPSASL